VKETKSTFLSVLGRLKDVDDMKLQVRTGTNLYSRTLISGYRNQKTAQHTFSIGPLPCHPTANDNTIHNNISGKFRKGVNA
jgi:hypothetical protein